MKAKKFFLILLVLGASGIGISNYFFKEKFYPNILLFFSFFFLLGWGSIFFLALEKSLNLKWTIPYRKILEKLSLLGSFHILIEIFILLNLEKFFIWAKKSQSFHPFVERKIKLWLNPQFFTLRSILIIVFYLISMFIFLNAYSRKNLEEKNIKLVKIFSPIALMFFAISVTIFSFDYISSLEPLWYSDIIGVYFFATSFLVALNFIAFSTISLKKQNFLQEIGGKNLYDVGGLIFAFTVFWAYISFAQYMLIWYANLPEEVFFYKKREGDFLILWFLLALFHFILPFFLLLTKKSKSSPLILTLVPIIYLFATYIDLYLYIFPAFGERLAIGITEISFFIFFVSLSFLVFRKLINKNNLIPLNDPLLKEALKR